MPKPRNHSGSNAPLDPAALRAMMERTLGGFGSKKRSEEQRAQELVYDAMEATTLERRMRLVLQALDLDPGNVDALLMLAEASSFNGEDRIEVLRDIVAAGAKRLGETAFKEMVPHFWGFIETRPYMRARQTLAEALHEAGRFDEAAQEYEEMLALNENDNQGVRHELLPLLLSQGRLEEARALMSRYQGECDYNVVFAWSRVLERFLSGEEGAAVDALAAARKQNPHMEAYVKGHRRLPKNLPGYYAPGSKDEAVCFAGILVKAWTAYPEAQTWLLRQPTKSADGMGSTGTEGSN
jgi:tetratricopeptide (TPR) repeat protein